MLLRLALFLVVWPVLSAADPWQIDPGTQVVVDVDWRGSSVEVQFPDLSGEIVFDETRPETARAHISVAAASATTGLAPVDRLMKSPSYLDASRYPRITFELDRLVQISRSTAEIFGRITLRGITRPLKFDARVLRYGPVPNDPGRFEAGFELTGRIDRRDFGSTAGLPDIAAELPVRIRLLMSSV